MSIRAALLAASAALALAAIPAGASAHHTESGNERAAGTGAQRTGVERTRMLNGHRLSYHFHTPEEIAPPQGVAAMKLQNALGGAPGITVPGPWMNDTTWCGTARTTDDEAHSTQANNPVFKFIYAYASDQPNRFTPGYGKMMQIHSILAANWVEYRSNYQLGMRFDLGTDCGPSYLDIQVIRLPWTRAQLYADQSAHGHIMDHVATQMPDDDIRRHYVVYLDTNEQAGSGGTGDLWSDGRPGWDNGSNSNGLGALLWAGPQIDDWGPFVLLHEMTHTLGAVALDAPHSSGAGHCWDDWDTMCYNDGGPLYHFEAPCAALEGGYWESWDCGSDDYFNMSPAPGSYLARHWNLKDNIFLCSYPECGATPTDQPPHAAFATVTSTGSYDDTQTIHVKPGERVFVDSAISSDDHMLAQRDLAAGGEVTQAQTATFTFPNPGQQEIYLWVSDNLGQTGEARQTVIVDPPTTTTTATTPTTTTTTPTTPGQTPRPQTVRVNPSADRPDDAATTWGYLIVEGPDSVKAGTLVRRGVKLTFTSSRSGSGSVTFKARGRQVRVAISLDEGEFSARVRLTSKQLRKLFAGKRTGTMTVVLSMGGRSDRITFKVTR